MVDVFELGTLVSVALGSSVLAAFVTQGVTTFRDKQMMKREVDYLALRLAIVFERYAEDATSVESSIKYYKHGQDDVVSTDLPDLGRLPDEKERWRDLDVRLTSKVLSFDEYRRSRQGAIDHTWNYSSPEDGIDVARAYALTSAMRAFHLASELRKQRKLPQFSSPSVWPDYLQSSYDDLPEHWKNDQT